MYKILGGRSFWLSRWLVGNKMAAAIPNITLLSDRDQRDKYKPHLSFSSLAGDFPRVFFMSHWLELGCMLWQWLLVAALLPASFALPPMQSTVSMWPRKGSFWLEDRCFPELKQPCWAGGSTANWQTSKLVGASSLMALWCSRVTDTQLLSPPGNYICILFKATVIFVSCSFCDCYVTELNLMSISLPKTALANIRA